MAAIEIEENEQCFVEPSPAPAAPLMGDGVQQMGVQSSTAEVEMVAVAGNGSTKIDMPKKLSDDESSEMSNSVAKLSENEEDEINEKAAAISRPKLAVFLFILNAVKNIIGTSVIIIPWCFAAMGYVLLPIVMAVIGVMCSFTFITLGRLRDKTGAKGYSDIFRYAFGDKFALGVDIIIAISAMAIVCCYTIVIGGTLPSVLETWNGDANLFSYAKGEQWLPGLWLIAILILFPVSCLKDLNSIRHLSMVGVGGIVWIVIGAIILVAQYGDYYGACYIPPTAGPNFKKPLMIFAAIPLLGGICDAHMNAPRFAYEYQAIAKANDGKYSFKFAVIVTIVIVIFLSLVFGIVGVSHIGLVIDTNILKSYGVENIPNAPKGMQMITSTMQFAGVLSVTISFVLFFNAMRASFAKLLFREGTYMAERFPDTRNRRILLTAVLVLIPTIIGSFVGKLGGFQGTLWGIAGSMIVYIFPMLAGLKLEIFESKLAKYGAYGTLVFGVLFSMLLGTPMAALDWAGVIPSMECPTPAVPATVA